MLQIELVLFFRQKSSSSSLSICEICQLKLFWHLALTIKKGSAALRWSVTLHQSQEQNTLSCVQGLL